MNLTKLFETQRKLDEHIIEEKGLHGQKLLDKKILALQVELGELANEWRGFKFWSEDREPRTEFYCEYCNRTEELSVYDFNGELVDIPCFICEEVSSSKNPLLEEYVDCLHFILSIGNDTVPDTSKAERFIHPKKMPNILDQFMWTNKKIVDMYEDYRDKKIPSTGYHFTHVFSAIWGLGEMLGFTPEQVESAYYEKNAENHRRQEVGY